MGRAIALREDFDGLALRRLSGHIAAHNDARRPISLQEWRNLKGAVLDNYL